MFRKSYHVLKNYNRISVNFSSLSYKFIEHCFEKKDHIFFNNGNIQKFNFHRSLASSLPLSSYSIENKIVYLCTCLRNGRVFFNDIDEVLQMYEENNYPLLKDVSLILLKCCGELLPDVDIKTRQRLTKRVWSLIQNRNSPLTLKHYNELLAIYAQNCELINPQEFLDNMRIKPDENIFCSLLNVVSKAENNELVSKVMSHFRDFKDLNSWNKNTFNVVIEAYALQGNFTEAYKIINEMESLGIMPTPETYLSLTFGYAKLGDIANIVQIFEKNQPSIEHIMKIIKIISFYGHGKHISSILKFLTVPLEKNKLFLINNTITELVHSGRRMEAFNLITNLPKDVEIMDACVEYVKCFVSEEIKLNTPDENILQIIRELTHNKQFSQVINKAAEVALCHNKESLALLLFADMKENNIPVRSHYYWPLLLQSYKNLETKKLYSLISHMKSLDIEEDEDTFIHYIIPFIDTTNPITATRKIIKAGINYTIAIISMGAFLLQNNRIKDAISLCSTFKIKFDFRESSLKDALIEGYKKSTNMSSYILLLLQIPYVHNPPFLYIMDALLNDAEDSKQLEQFIKFLQILRQKNVKISMTDILLIKARVSKMDIDTTTIEIIKNLLTSIGNDKGYLNVKSDSERSTIPTSVLSPFPHPVKMDSKELKNHIIELESKNMYTRGSAKKLLQEYCQKNNLKGAEELKQSIISNGFEWTPGMSAFLFGLYTKHNLLDKAKVELTEIQNNFEHFQLDSFKIITYAISLVRNNRLEEAMNIIRDTKNVNTKVQCSNKCLELLTVIANSEHYASIEKVIDALIESGHCKVNNSLLKPMIQKHLSDNNIDLAVDLFEHYVNKYKCASLKQILLSTLISDVNSSVPNAVKNLKRVLKGISDIHGENIAIIHLVKALAKAGEVEKLQEVFETHEVNMQLLFYQLRTDTVESNYNMLQMCETILNIKNIDKGPLCDIMISLYEEEKDYNAATWLLSKMEKLNIEPSRSFKLKFNNLATNKNQMILN